MTLRRRESGPSGLFVGLVQGNSRRALGGGEIILERLAVRQIGLAGRRGRAALAFGLVQIILEALARRAVAQRLNARGGAVRRRGGGRRAVGGVLIVRDRLAVGEIGRRADIEDAAVRRDIVA